MGHIQLFNDIYILCLVFNKSNLVDHSFHLLIAIIKQILQNSFFVLSKYLLYKFPSIPDGIIKIPMTILLCY